MRPNRSARVLLLAALVSLTTVPRFAPAQDDDWSVTRRPGSRRPARPARPTRPGTPTRPRTPGIAPPVTRPAVARPPVVTGQDADARRTRLFETLFASSLASAPDTEARLPALCRLARERDGSLDALVTRLRELAASGPRAEATCVLAGVLQSTGRMDEASAAYSRCADAFPQSPAPWLALARLRTSASDPAGARPAFEQALTRTRARPERLEILRALRDLAIDAGDLPEASQRQRQLVQLDPATFSLRTEYAETLLSRGRFADAAREFGELSRTLGGDRRLAPRLSLGQARALEGAGRHDEAIAAARQGLAAAGPDAAIRRELLTLLADAHAAVGRLDAWIHVLEREGGGDARLRATAVAELYERTGDTERAIAAWQRALRLAPRDLDVLRHLARLYRQSGQRREEITTWRTLVTLSPRDAEFLEALVDLLVADGRTPEALQLVARASALAGDDADAHERAAGLYARLGRQDLALAEMRRQAQLDPESPTALAQLGRQLLEAGRRDEADSVWRRIRTSARDPARGAYELGRVYADNDRVPDAAEAFREAVLSRPEFVEAWTALAESLERLRRMDEAVGAWQEVMARARTQRDLRRRARESIVRIWSMDRNLATHVASLERAFATAPPDLEAGRTLAEAYRLLHRPEDAQRVLERIVESEPTDAVSLEALERLATARSDDALALRVLQRLVDLDPSRARDLYERMAAHAMSLHREDDALEFAARAVRLNDQDAQAHLRIARLFRQRGDIDRAIAALDRALTLDARLFPTYFELADLLLAHRSDAARAITLLRHVIRDAPDDDFVLQAGRSAIQLASATGAAPDLERDLTAAAAAHPGRASYRRLLVTWFDALARPLLARARADGDPRVRAEARVSLQALGRRALAPLLEALADSDPVQQRIALDILGPLGNRNATDALLTRAETASADVVVRRRAVAAAAMLAEPKNVPRLAALERSSDDTQVAALATWGLARAGGPAALAELVQAADRARALEVRAMAILGLAGSPAPAVRQKLRAFALDPQELPLARSAAWVALGLDGAADAALATVLAAQLEDPSTDPLARRVAARLLAHAPADRTLDAVLVRALFTRDPVLRAACASALAARASPRPASVPASRATPLLDADASAMPGAAALLGAWLADAAGTPDLGAARTRLRDTFLHEMRAMLRFGRSRAVLALLAGDDSGRDEGLGALRAALLPELLALATTDQDVPLARDLVRSLATVGEPQAATALATLAGHRDVGVSLAAVSALSARIRDRSATTALVALVSAQPPPPWLVRRQAIRALAASDDPAAEPVLVRALAEDPFESVRLEAAVALAGRRAVPAVRTALDRAAASDPAAAVREAAAASAAGTRP